MRRWRRKTRHNGHLKLWRPALFTGGKSTLYREKTCQDPSAYGEREASKISRAPMLATGPAPCYAEPICSD